MIGAKEIKVSKTLSFRRRRQGGGRQGGERQANEWMDAAQCGNERADMSPGCH